MHFAYWATTTALCAEGFGWRICLNPRTETAVVRHVCRWETSRSLEGLGCLSKWQVRARRGCALGTQLCLLCDARALVSHTQAKPHFPCQ